MNCVCVLVFCGRHNLQAGTIDTKLDWFPVLNGWSLDVYSKMVEGKEWLEDRSRNLNSRAFSTYSFFHSMRTLKSNQVIIGWENGVNQPSQQRSHVAPSDKGRVTWRWLIEDFPHATVSEMFPILQPRVQKPRVGKGRGRNIGKSNTVPTTLPILPSALPYLQLHSPLVVLECLATLVWCQ